MLYNWNDGRIVCCGIWFMAMGDVMMEGEFVAASGSWRWVMAGESRGASSVDRVGKTGSDHQHCQFVDIEKEN